MKGARERSHDRTGPADGQRRRSAAPISHDRLSEIIGSIYECVLTPANWAGVLETVCREFTFAGGVLSVIRTQPAQFGLEAICGYAPEWIARLPQYASEAVDLWGGPRRVLEYPLDEPLIQSQTIGPTAAFGTNYYERWAKPQGLFDQVVVLIARDSTMLGTIGLGRHTSAGEVGPFEVDGLRLLAPHFRRAVAISNLFDMKTVEAATYAGAFEAFNVGAILVDEYLAVVHANAAGKAILAEGAPFGHRGQRLKLYQSASQAMLAAAVADAARDVTALGQKGIGIPALLRNGDPCVIHVLPLRPTETLTGRQRAVAALFVTTMAQAPPMPTAALTLLYDLTPAEARVFELICDGETQGEIATKLGISRGTVKTHLLHVFQKTGCKRQTDLVKLAAGLTLPV